MVQISEDHRKLFKALDRANESAVKKRNNNDFVYNPNKYIRAIYTKEDEGLTQEEICSRLRSGFGIDNDISKVYFDILAQGSARRESVKLPRGDIINTDSLYGRLHQAEPILKIHKANKGATYSLKK